MCILVCQSLSRSVSQFVSFPNRQSVKHSVSQSVRTVSAPVGRSTQPVTPFSQSVCLSVGQSVSRPVRQAVVSQSICQPVTHESFLPQHHLQLFSHSVTLNSVTLRVSVHPSVQHIILLTNKIIRRKRLHGMIVLMACVPLPS